MTNMFHLLTNFYHSIILELFSFVLANNSGGDYKDTSFQSTLYQSGLKKG